MKLKCITYMQVKMPRISGISGTGSVIEPHINAPSSDLRGVTVELEAPLLCVREVLGSNWQTGCSHRFFLLFLHLRQVVVHANFLAHPVQPVFLQRYGFLVY